MYKIYIVFFIFSLSSLFAQVIRPNKDVFLIQVDFGESAISGNLIDAEKEYVEQNNVRIVFDDNIQQSKTSFKMNYTYKTLLVPQIKLHYFFSDYFSTGFFYKHNRIEQEMEFENRTPDKIVAKFADINHYGTHIDYWLEGWGFFFYISGEASYVSGKLYRFPLILNTSHNFESSNDLSKLDSYKVPFIISSFSFGFSLGANIFFSNGMTLKMGLNQVFYPIVIESNDLAEKVNGFKVANFTIGFGYAFDMSKIYKQ